MAEDPGTSGRRRAGGNETFGFGQCLGRADAVTGLPQEPAKSLVEHPGAHAVPRGIDTAEGSATEFHGPPEIADETGALRGPLQEIDMVANLSIDKISAVAQALPELEGPLVVAQRFAEGIHALGCHARFDHRRHRTRPVAGGIPVIGELRRRWRVRACIANPRRERPREGSVQPRPLPRQQLRVHDFLEQRVVKRVAHLSARSAHRHQDLVVDHLAQRRIKLLGPDVEDRRQKAVVEPPTRSRRDAKHILCGLRELRHTGKEHVPELWRKLARGSFRRCREQLAARALEDVVDLFACRSGAANGGELRHQLVARERLEVDALDAVAPLELGEERQERVVPVDLVRPSGQDEQHGRRSNRADEEKQQIAGRGVRPVKVLDDGDDRLRPSQPLEDAEHQLE